MVERVLYVVTHLLNPTVSSQKECKELSAGEYAVPHTKSSIVCDIPNRAIRFRSAASTAMNRMVLTEEQR